MMMTKKKKKKKFGLIQGTLKRTGGTIRPTNVDDNNQKVTDEVINPPDLHHRHGGRSIDNGGRLLREEDNLVRGHFSVQHS